MKARHGNIRTSIKIETEGGGVEQMRVCRNITKKRQKKQHIRDYKEKAEGYSGTMQSEEEIN